MPSHSNLRRKVVDAFASASAAPIEGADSLFDEKTLTGQFRRLPVDSIKAREDQPRQTMDPEALEELTQSVRDRGILQPIRVRAHEPGYQIIAGERRWMAAQQAGLREIPAIVVTADDDQAYLDALIENIQREDLNAVDRAKALVRLRVALGRQSWEEVGKAIGIGRQHVHRLLNVTQLPEVMQDDVRAGSLSEKHARALLALRNYPHLQSSLWQRMHEEHMSGDTALAAARELRPGAPRQPRTPASATPPSLAQAVTALKAALRAASPDEVRTASNPLSELLTLLTTALLVDRDSEPDEVQGTQP